MSIVELYLLYIAIAFHQHLLSLLNHQLSIMYNLLLLDEFLFS